MSDLLSQETSAVTLRRRRIQRRSRVSTALAVVIADLVAPSIDTPAAAARMGGAHG